VNIAYTGEEGSTQRGAQRCVQTARTTSVGRSHTMSVQVAHGCARAQCSQHMGVHARSVHKRIAVYKQGWAIIILKCQRGHAVYKQGWALVPVAMSFINRSFLNQLSDRSPLSVARSERCSARHSNRNARLRIPTATTCATFACSSTGRSAANSSRSAERRPASIIGVTRSFFIATRCPRYTATRAVPKSPCPRISSSSVTLWLPPPTWPPTYTPAVK
jgi:hypothetical protein